MRQEHPSKVRPVELLPGTHARMWAECHTSRTPRQLSGPCVNITVAESHSFFFFLPSQYGDVYTLFLKDPLPVFFVTASKLL